MKTKNIIILVVLIILVISLFGYRYWFVPNFIMKQQVEPGGEPKPEVIKREKKAPKPKVQKKEEPKAQKPATVAKDPEAAKKPEQAKKVAPPEPETRVFKNLLKNSSFKTGQENWQPWQHAKNQPENVKVISVGDNAHFDTALRIENPNAVLIGMQQLASMKSGAVYRLSGTARSTRTHDDEIIFGGRIAIFLPPQKEQQLVWMGEYNKWWNKEHIFTNQVSGIAVIYVHMGYGGVASTGEFSNIKLEEISN